jgi:hypothetical protein
MTPQLAAILDGAELPSAEAWTSWCEVHTRQASVREYVAEYGGALLDAEGVAIVLPVMLLRALVDRDALADEVARLRRVVASMGGEA